MTWDKVTVGDYCEITSSKRIFFSDYVPAGVPFYRSKEIIQKHRLQEINEPLYITQRKYDDILEKFGVPESGDMLLTSVGTIGTPYIVKDNDYFYFKDGNLTWFRKFTDKLLSKFLYYWIQSHDGEGALYSLTIGSSQKALTIVALKGLEIPLPPLPIQRRIADILSAYDDLIENNQKQIKLLEEAAMRLYKEWFVYLRFPGYENTPIVDGVPEGWERAFTKEFVEFNYGKALKAGDRIGTKYPVYGSSGIVGYHDKFLVEAPAVIVGRKGNVGSVFISFENAFPIDTVYFISTDLSPYYMYFELKFRTFVNSDAAVPGLNRTFALSMEMLRPSDSILEKFDAQVSGLFELQRKLNKQSTLLQQARDKLLPKLMSGEIEV